MISIILIKYITISLIFHSFFKSYILINLKFLLDGNSILDENREALYKKYLLLCFIFDGSLNLIFDYIVFFIPSINNIYLFVIKSLVEHIGLLLYTIKSYKSKYIPLIRHRNLINYFDENIMIYKKVLIFSFLYSCVFIGFQFYKIILLYDYVDAFYFNYILNVCIELLFVLISMIIFYPQKITGDFIIPNYYHYNNNNNRIYNAQITNEENKLNISNLNKNILKNEYKKNNIPLILINPFSKSNNAFDYINVGKIV
jgi:hypothetical protein